VYCRIGIRDQRFTRAIPRQVPHGPLDGRENSRETGDRQEDGYRTPRVRTSRDSTPYNNDPASFAATDW
jgi:hypothetical protein